MLAAILVTCLKDFLHSILGGIHCMHAVGISILIMPCLILRLMHIVCMHVMYIMRFHGMCIMGFHARLIDIFAPLCYASYLCEQLIKLRSTVLWAISTSQVPIV